jgi:hypothetical protein
MKQIVERSSCLGWPHAHRASALGFPSGSRNCHSVLRKTFGELHSEHLLAALERMRHDCGNRKKPPSQAGDMGENA